MAAHVQTQWNSSGSASSISVTLTLTAGNAVVVTLITGQVGLGSLSGLAQTAGDTLTLGPSIDNGGSYMAQYHNDNVAGGSTTFTFSWTGATRVGLYVTEASGLVTSSAYDQGASTNQANQTTHSTGTTATLSQADEFCVATFNGDGSGLTSATGISNGFTTPTNGDQINGGTNQFAYLAYKVVSATTGVETTLTTADNLNATGLIGTYKAAGAGAPPLTVGLAEPVIGSSLFM